MKINISLTIVSEMLMFNSVSSCAMDSSESWAARCILDCITELPDLVANAVGILPFFGLAECFALLDELPNGGRDYRPSFFQKFEPENAIELSNCSKDHASAARR